MKITKIRMAAPSAALALVLVAGTASAQSTEPFPAVIELSSLNGSNGFVLNGIDVNDASGYSVSCVGDVNGDGIEDLIIGAYNADPNGNDYSGESYVVFGGNTVGSTGVIELSTLNGSSGFVLHGINGSDRSGGSVSSAGDVNGDGIDDLIIGAYNADPNGNSDAGESYVVFGSVTLGSTGEFNLSSLNGVNGFVLNGINSNDRSGSSVSSAGDVNGDGIDDLIIGAPLADPNGNTDAGESYVVFGDATLGSGGVVELASLNGSNGFVINGVNESDFSGISVSSAGDVNGDGIDDLFVGASGADYLNDSGKSYLILGGVDVGSTGVIELSTLNVSIGFVFNGISSNDRSGRSVSSAGDVNGDGIDDLIIGAENGDPTSGNSDAGESYVVFGGATLGSSSTFSLAFLNGANGFVLNGINSNDRSGSSVSSAGDVNGDGIDDLIIGARLAGPNGNTYAGESYVVFGGATLGSGGVVELASLNGSNGFVLNGIDGSDLSGRSVSSGDLNGDGIDDLIIGASGADPNGNSRAGESFVVFGRTFQVWSRGGGGAFEDGPNWLLGSDPTGGAVVIEPEFGGIVTLTQPVDLYLSSLKLGSQRGVATLDIGQSSLLGVDVPLELSASASIAGLGLLVAPAGITNYGALNGDGLSIVADEGITNYGILSGLNLNIFSTSGLANRGLIDVDGRKSTGVTRVRIIGSLNNESEGQILLSHGGTELEADGIANSGEIDVAFADATVLGDFTNGQLINSKVGFVINGIDDNDLSGSSVSSAGDVNGDGIDDLVIGAFRADPNGNNSAGESYVVFGGSSVGSGEDINLSALNGTNGFVLNGIDTYDNSGVSVSSAGDVNGDGFGDLIIGADYADPNGIGSAGESYVVFGGLTIGLPGSIELASLNGSNGFVINGFQSYGRSGYSVSSAGDVNGDGIDDLIIGAMYATSNGIEYAGESYVVFGGLDLGANGSVNLSSLNVSAGFILNGIDDSDQSGRSVSAAGDVNGDGIDDLIVGAGNADPNGINAAGESYVVFGDMGLSSGGSIELSSLNGTGGFVINGIDASDNSGISVSFAGDVNGDGIDDLIIGAFGADPNGIGSAGESYVVFGGGSIGSDGFINLSTLNGTNGFVLNGIDAFDLSGGSVSSAGDVNDDGFADIIVGAFFSDPSGVVDAGESYVVMGGAGVGQSGSFDLALLDGTNGFILRGINTNDRSGATVSSAGDVNGDGVDDILIGAPYASPNGASSGESYVVFGRRAGEDEPFPAVIELSQLDATFGDFAPGRITAASSSELLFGDDVANSGTIVLAADSKISILGSLSGNGVEGPSGPGSAGSVFAFDGILPGFAFASFARGGVQASAGIMRFDGDLQLSASSSIEFEIAGTSPGAGGHDQIVVAGDFGVSGSANIQLANGFVPSAGDTFQLLEFDAITGGFASLTISEQLLDLNVDTSKLLIDGTISIPAGCPADLNNDGALNFFDVSFFLSNSVDFNGDMVFNFFDVSAFLNAYSVGCP